MDDLRTIFNSITKIDSYKRIDDSHPLDLYVGVDDLSRWTLLMICDARPSQLSSSRMLLAKIGQRQDGRWSVSLSLMNDKYKDMFILFCGDIIESSRPIINREKSTKFAEWASEAWEKDETEFNEVFFRKIVCLNILFKKTDYIVKHATWYEMGYKAQVVTYTLSYLFFAIEKVSADVTLDFRSIWNNQDISHALELQIEQIAEVMYSHLVSPNRDVENVTEWAKREACWKKAKQIEIPLSNEFTAELALKSEEQEDNRAAGKDIKLQNSASQMIQVAEIGVDAWKRLLEWGIAKHIFTPQDISFIRVAISMEKGKFPSEKQCARIMQVLDKARKEGFE